jgi:hypothetical protein
VVRGQITRDVGENLSNYIIALYGKSSLNSATIQRLQLTVQDGLRSPDIIGVTDSSGRFHVQQSFYHGFDSLAVAVLAPDRPMFLGSFFAVKDTIPDDTLYENRSSVDGGGCSCSTSPEIIRLVTAYSYNAADSIKINLPY